MRSFGTDPEFLIVDGQEPKSAINIIKKDSTNRLCIDGHQFYYDNVLAECAIKPAFSREEAIENVQQALRIYADLIKPYRLVPRACVDFPEKELQHKDARKVGCAPDACAYRMTQQEPPRKQIIKGTLRSCGGHVHVGNELLSGNGHEPVLFVYLLDLLVGVPSLWLDRDETSPRRRALYGQAGRYRCKDYGIEYRSLGNYWLGSPELVGLIYDLANYAIDLIESGQANEIWDFNWDRFFESENGSLAAAWLCKLYDPNDLQQVINSGNKEKAIPYLKMAKGLLNKSLRSQLTKVLNRDECDFYASWQIN